MKTLLAIAVVLLTGCAATNVQPTNYGLKWYEDTSGTLLFQGVEYTVDMPRTFESGSCIAADGTLVLRRPGATWYCKQRVGLTRYTLEELSGH